MTLFDQYTSIEKINDYLKQKAYFLNADEMVEGTEIVGGGNMNVVLRVQTNLRTLILKQSRPFVQKYPNIPAPVERIAVEGYFYKLMNSHPFFPKVLKYIPKDYILLLEDLGDCENLTSLYNSRIVSEGLIQDFTLALHHIHKRSTPLNYPENRGLRKLNHQHIFVLPFTEYNGFSLDSIQKGLNVLGAPYKTNKVLKKKIDDAGKLYLDKGDTLLHGDYYPGSWMRVGEHLYIIDPEFSFVGLKSFDLGVMAAHLILATGQSSILEQVCKIYPGTVQEEQIQIFCGIEIMRRLIGLAQLPIERTLKEKKELLTLGKELILY